MATPLRHVLKYAAGVCAAGYQPGTIERGLLEQFAALYPATTCGNGS
jgi:hypothetical protein